MVQYSETLLCDNCGVEILWNPYVAGKRTYCCKDCYETQTCDCGSRMDDEEDQRSKKASIDTPSSPYTF